MIGWWQRFEVADVCQVGQVAPKLAVVLAKTLVRPMQPEIPIQ